MKKFCNYLSMAGYLVAFLWILMKAIGGTAGVITICILTALALVVLIWGGVDKKDVNSPLLLDLFMVCSHLILFEYPDFWPFTTAISVAGIADIIDRTVNKRYNTESWGAFIKAELRLPPFLDLIFLFNFVIITFKEEQYSEPLVWIIPAFFIFDFFRQKLAKKPEKPASY